MRDAFCRLCPLHEGVKSVCVPAEEHLGDGPPVLFVGEAPGEHEDDQCRPFVGPAGHLLRQALDQYVAPHPYVITNTVRCRPPANRDPRVGELRACMRYLIDDIALYRPKVVVPLGSVALANLLPDLEGGVTKWGGRAIPGKRFTTFPIMHPSAMLYPGGDARLPIFEGQFKTLQGLLRGAAPLTRQYERVTVEEACRRLAAVRGTFAIDFETGGTDELKALNPRFGHIVSCAISTEPGKAFWWPWPRQPHLLSPLRQALHETLMRAGNTMIAHNAIYEVKWLLWHVIRPRFNGPDGWWVLRTIRWPIRDTMLFHHLVDENSPHGLEVLTSLYAADMVGYDNEVTRLVALGTPHGSVDIDVLGAYNAGDADATLRSERALYPEVMRDEGLARLWGTVVEPAVWAIAWMELHGRKVDAARLKALQDDLVARTTKGLAEILAHPAVAAFRDSRRKRVTKKGVEVEVIDLPGGEVNPNSDTQMREILFDGLKIPCLKRTEGGERSTKQQYIEPYRSFDPLVGKFLDWKGEKTLLDKYLVPLRDFIQPDGFVYGSYMMHATVTGQWASSHPNMQNWTPELRQVVVSRFPGGEILTRDYSQIELKLLAWKGGVRFFLDAFARKTDLHAEMAVKVASRVLGRQLTLEEVKADHKAKDGDHSWRNDYGKRPNFGLGYGAMPTRIHLEFGVPLAVAEIIYSEWHRATDGQVLAFLHAMGKEAEEKGYLRSEFGRIRRLRDAMLPGGHAKHVALMQAGNFPIQTLDRDLTAWACGRAAKEMADRDLQSVLMGETHDSIDADCHPDEVDEVSVLLDDVMVRQAHEAFPWLGITLETDAKVGDTWGQQVKWRPSTAPVTARR